MYLFSDCFETSQQYEVIILFFYNSFLTKCDAQSKIPVSSNYSVHNERLLFAKKINNNKTNIYALATQSTAEEHNSLNLCQNLIFL